MLHLIFDVHAGGEGLNKGWLRAANIAAVQAVELTAGLCASLNSSDTRRIGRSGSQNRSVIPTWLGWNPSRL